MDVNADGREQWTIQSALRDHPEIVVTAAPGKEIECSMICQEFAVPADRINSLVQTIRAVARGETNVSASPSYSVISCPEEMTMRLLDAHGEYLTIHQLDAEGFIEKLLAAQLVAGGN